MGFFYAEAKAAPKTKPARKSTGRGVIPIASLNKMGCDVCPRKKDWPKLESPQLEPEGSDYPLAYLMGSGPNADEDQRDMHWVGPAGHAILSKFSQAFLRNDMRFGHMTQCMPPLGEASERDLKVDVVELECCRPRITSDIERSKPLVVIGVGDQALNWATGLQGNAMRFRGQLIATKIGNHACWYYPILWPNYAFKKKQYGKSEYEMAMEHDCDRIEWMLKHEMLKTPKIAEAPYDGGIELITGQEPGDFQRLERALADCMSMKRSAVDIETNGLRPFIADPMLISASVGSFQRSVAFAIDHPDGWGTKDRINKVRDLFGEYLLYSGKKFAHNLAMEQEWLSFFYGSQILRRTEWGDTMALCHTLDERGGTKSLDVQIRMRFGFFLKDQSRVDVRQPKWWTKAPLKDILRYNGLDTKWTDALASELIPMVHAEGASQWAEYERKVRLCPTLIMTEAKGLPADLDYARDLEPKLKKQAEDIEAKIRKCPEVKKYSTRFGVFSPTAPEHVVKLIRDICDREEAKRVDRDGKVSYSSDEEVLNQIPRTAVPSAHLILEHRGVEKLRGTYLAPVLSGQVISADGLIHSKYSSMEAVTGRLNSYDPNIQNWPRRKHKEIRGIIYAPRGLITAADYGQIEFRVVGMASEDDNLVKYCWTGYDVHGFWAQRMVEVYPSIKDWIVEEFSVDWDAEGMKTLRQESKNKWVFPQLFGSSLRSCADQLHLPDYVAKDLGAEFWDQFPGVKAWQSKLLKSYEKKLYVETLSGRRRRGPMTPNEIINHPIQGTAADIVLEGMNALSERADLFDDIELQPSLNVHDDLSTILADENYQPKVDIIVREMCLPRFDWINVPLVVEVSVGRRWSELKEVAKYRSDELFGHANPYKSAGAKR